MPTTALTPGHNLTPQNRHYNTNNRDSLPLCSDISVPSGHHFWPPQSNRSTPFWFAPPPARSAPPSTQTPWRSLTPNKPSRRWAGCLSSVRRNGRGTRSAASASITERIAVRNGSAFALAVSHEGKRQLSHDRASLPCRRRRKPREPPQNFPGTVPVSRHHALPPTAFRPRL